MGLPGYRSSDHPEVPDTPEKGGERADARIEPRSDDRSAEADFPGAGGEMGGREHGRDPNRPKSRRHPGRLDSARRHAASEVEEPSRDSTPYFEGRRRDSASPRGSSPVRTGNTGDN